MRETIKSLKAQLAKRERAHTGAVAALMQRHASDLSAMRERNSRQAVQIEDAVSALAAKDRRINELLTASNTNEIAARAARAECVALQARLTEATRIMATLGARPPLNAELREGR